MDPHIFNSRSTTDESNLLTEYITPDSIVTVAADSNSIETVWFIKVIENECVSNGEDQDDYGHIIIENAMFHRGNFLERISHSLNSQTFKVSKKVTYFYTESVIYPFVNFKEEKGFVLHNNEWSDIIHFIEQNNFCHL